MTIGGTAMYATEPDLPPLVAAAAQLAEQLGFDLCCLPAHGRLLQVLAAGRTGGRIGEVGTGCGCGVAWMLSRTRSDTQIISIEIDDERAAAAASLFADHANVTVLHGDWPAIVEHGPFDLFVLDGGPAGGKTGEKPFDPTTVLQPGGALVLDDFTPMAGGPAMAAEADDARRHWLAHPKLFTTEVLTSPTTSSLVGIRK
jgi:predicted O-methyltransferase YrrM